jgi:hypothetical protein
MAVIGIISLGAFAVWSGASVLWSVAPDRTWTELNRSLTYELVIVLGVIVGASERRALEFLGGGTLLVVLAVTIYALAQKIVPGLHVGGLFNLDQTRVVPRLQAPFGYWNALGLFIVLGVPIALAVVLDTTRGTRMRLGALASIELMLLAIALTYSRGALLALAGGLAVGVGVGGSRLRLLTWLALACVATVPPLVFGLASHNLTTVSVGLGTRELAGAELGGLLLVTLAALVFVGSRLLLLEQHIDVGPEKAKRIGRMLLAGVGVALVCVVIALAASSRGLTGTVTHAWNSFTKTQTIGNYNPARLVSADSANRWVWWKEAAGAFSDRPVAGWGAGSFPVLHLLYRRDPLSVQQPHSVPLQFLAETGVIGALLAIGGYALLAAAGIGTVRRTAGSRRLMSAALLSGVVAYGIHACYDWDWDIPGVTLPAVVFLGALAGARGVIRMPERVALAGPSRTVRLIALAAFTATLWAFAFSGVVPSLAANKTSSAVVAASSASRPVLEHALATAQDASRLNPLSDAGLLASATISLHLGNPRQARAYLLEAINRDPEDVQAWGGLAYVETRLGDHANWIAAIRRVATLDPLGSETAALIRAAELLTVPPADSATARPTPPLSSLSGF